MKLLFKCKSKNREEIFCADKNWGICDEYGHISFYPDGGKLYYFDKYSLEFSIDNGNTWNIIEGRY